MGGRSPVVVAAGVLLLGAAPVPTTSLLSSTASLTVATTTVIVPTSGVTTLTQHTEHPDRSHDVGTSDQGPAQSVPAIHQMVGPGRHHREAKQCDNYEQSGTRAAWATAWFTFFYFLSTVGLVIVGWKIGKRQLALMDGSLQAARDAADAAKSASEHVRRSERAWIFVRSSLPIDGWPTPSEGDFEGRILSLEWTMSNHGKTPAWLTHTDIRFEIREWPLPGTPFPVELKPCHDLPITRDKEHGQRRGVRLYDEAQWRGFLERKLCLVFYGMVYYRDAFGDHHWSRFCETWSMGEGELVQLARLLTFAPVGPTAEWTAHD